MATNIYLTNASGVTENLVSNVTHVSVGSKLVFIELVYGENLEKKGIRAFGKDEFTFLGIGQDTLVPLKGMARLDLRFDAPVPVVQDDEPEETEDTEE